MARSKMIDWLINPDSTSGQTHNIVKGCNGPAGDGKHCSYCYAVQMVKRYNYIETIARKEVEAYKKAGIHREVYQSEIFYKHLIERINNFVPTFFSYTYEQRLRKKPTMYFFSMSDPADWKDDWHMKIVNKIKQYPQHTFVILTKRPEIYKRHLFPENCWLGVTVSTEGEWKRIAVLVQLQSKNKTFVSFEPLYGSINNSVIDYIKTGQSFYHNDGNPIDWVIVGPERGKHIPYEWIKPFFSLEVPVFMKGSCRWEALRQEWPEGYLGT